MKVTCNNAQYIVTEYYKSRGKGLYPKKKKQRNRNYEFEAQERAKSILKQYGLNNPWTHFVTITFDNKKLAKLGLTIEDKEGIVKYLRTHLNNYKKRVDNKFKYILIPEQGKKGRLHFHALFYMTNTEYLEFLFYDKKRKNEIYVNRYFKEHFGGGQIIPIKQDEEDKKHITYYIMKYITKKNQRIFKHYYYASQKLKKDSVIVQVVNQGINNAKRLVKELMGLVDKEPMFSNAFTNKWTINRKEIVNGKAVDILNNKKSLGILRLINYLE